MTHRYSVALALLLAWLPAAVFAQTIRSFSPALGNAGTLVTLNGTDLDLVAAVAVNGTLRFFDSAGRLLRTATYLDGQPLNLSALPAGLYWLMLDQAPAQPLLNR